MSIAERNPFRSSDFVPVMPGMYRLGVEPDGAVKLVPYYNGCNRAIGREELLSIAECVDTLRGQPFVALRVSDARRGASNSSHTVHKFEEISVGRFSDLLGDYYPYFQSPVVSFKDGDKVLTVRGDETPMRFDSDLLCWESASHTTVVYVGPDAVRQVFAGMFSMFGQEWIPHDLDLILAALSAADMAELAKDCRAVMTYAERLSDLASDKIGRAELKRAGLLEDLFDVNRTLSIWKGRNDLYRKFFSTKS